MNFVLQLLITSIVHTSYVGCKTAESGDYLVQICKDDTGKVTRIVPATKELMNEYEEEWF